MITDSTNENDDIKYAYDKRESLLSKIIQFYFKISDMRNGIEKHINNNEYHTKPDPIPNTFNNKYYVEDRVWHNRNYWTISPKNKISEKIIFYYHGGAYIANLISKHWDLIDKIIEKTNSTFIVPNYPLAPEFGCQEAYDFVDSLYNNYLGTYDSQNIIFMGDSAGGGLALGHAMNLRNRNIPGPSQIILISPWLDITMSNAEILNLEKYDKMLGLKGTIMAGELYAKSISKEDYRVSPIYGDFNNLGKISIFTGTNDLLFADCKKLHFQLHRDHISHNYFEYPKMFHVWVAVTKLKEAQNAIAHIADLILKE